MDMEQEMQEVIKKNLPQHVGEVLKQRLEKAECDAVEVKELSRQLDKKNDLIKKLEESIFNYNKLDDRNAALEAREKAVAEKETKQKIAELEYQIHNEKDKSQFAKDVALGLVRNIEFRRNVFDTERKDGFVGQHGQWVQEPANNKTTSEDNTAK